MANANKMVSPHLKAALNRWSDAGHALTEFTELTALSSAYTSQLWAGTKRPRLDTMETILAKMAKRDPEFARNLLSAYLQDSVPEGWRNRVKLAVDGHAMPKAPAAVDAVIESLLKEYKQSRELRVLLGSLSKILEEKQPPARGRRQKST